MEGISLALVDSCADNTYNWVWPLLKLARDGELPFAQAVPTFLPVDGGEEGAELVGAGALVDDGLVGV